MADFKKLLVWQRAHDLNLRVSRAATKIRDVPYLTLRSQMVRAALSIPANIVEGRGQSTDAHFARFLRISLNSSSELEYHLITARDLGAISVQLFNSLLGDLVEVRRMLHGLIAKLDDPPTSR